MGPQQVYLGAHPGQSSEDDNSPYPSGSLGEGAGSRCERFGGKQGALRRKRQGVSVTRRPRTWRGHCAEGRDSVHVKGSRAVKDRERRSWQHSRGQMEDACWSAGEWDVAMMAG